MQIEAEELKRLMESSPQFIPVNTSVVPMENFWFPGKKYFIRTVTHHLTGVLVSVNQFEVIIKEAAWIADDGRFTDALKAGSFNEVEMFPDGPVAIGRGSLIDAVQIINIPTSQK